EHAGRQHGDLPIVAAVEPVPPGLRAGRYGRVLSDVVAAQRRRALLGAQRVDAPDAVHGAGIADIDALLVNRAGGGCGRAVLVDEDAVELLGRSQDIALRSADIAAQRADVDARAGILLVDLRRRLLLAAASSHGESCCHGGRQALVHWYLLL